YLFFFSSRRRHTRFSRDWSSDVCSSDLTREGMCKAFDPIRKRKWLLFHSHLVCCWYPGGRLHLLCITALQAGTYMEVLIKITKKRPTANCWHRLRCRRTEAMPKTSYFYKTLS